MTKNRKQILKKYVLTTLDKGYKAETLGGKTEKHYSSLVLPCYVDAGFLKCFPFSD